MTNISPFSTSIGGPKKMTFKFNNIFNFESRMTLFSLFKSAINYLKLKGNRILILSYCIVNFCGILRCLKKRYKKLMRILNFNYVSYRL